MLGGEGVLGGPCWRGESGRPAKSREGGKGGEEPAGKEGAGEEGEEEAGKGKGGKSAGESDEGGEEGRGGARHRDLQKPSGKN